MVQITHYTRPNYTDHPQVTIHWIHCIENIFTVQDFEQLALVLKKKVCPEMFHCIEYIFYHSGFLSNFCACLEKQSLPWNVSLYWIYFLHSGFLRNLRLPWKTECALNFFTVLKYFLTLRIFEQHALALKTKFPLNMFTVLNILFTFRSFKQLALALENRLCTEFTYIFFILEFWATCACPDNIIFPEIFHCIEYTFHIQDFWTTCVFPDKQGVPWIHSNFLSFRIFEQLALTLNNRIALNFSLYWKIFYHSRFLSNLRLRWKQNLPWNFSSRVGCRHPPRTPVSMIAFQCRCEANAQGDIEQHTIKYKFLLFRIYFRTMVTSELQKKTSSWGVQLLPFMTNVPNMKMFR